MPQSRRIEPAIRAKILQDLGEAAKTRLVSLFVEIRGGSTVPGLSECPTGQLVGLFNEALLVLTDDGLTFKAELMKAAATSGIQPGSTPRVKGTA